MYSIVDYTATEDQENFTIPFGYLDESHIYVYINGTLVDSQFIVLNTPTVVTLTDVDIDTPHPDVEAGDTVRVRRITPIDEPIVDYSNGSNLGESDLDTQNLQALYLLQEMQDNHANAIDNENTILAAALAAQAAAAAALVSENNAETAATNAETAETNAETAETNAETAEVNAETALAATLVARDAALAAQTAAELAETNAETAETNAETAQAAAEAARDAALTAETNAETAETNAESARDAALAAQTAAEAAATAAEGHADDAAASAAAAAASAASVTDQSLTQTFRDLYLRTHPDFDQQPSKVQLMRVAEIVMNDGERISSGWDGLTADITASGAGGLDTGSEGASTWYEIYAIRNSSTDAKNLLLHKMKAYSTDQSQLTDDSNVGFRVASGTVSDLLAQGFQTSVSAPLEFMEVKLLKNGAPTGKVWLEVRSDSAGNPNTVLATSDKVDVSTIDSQGNRVVRFYFRTPVTLTAATQYHLVLNGDYTRSDVTCLTVRYQGSGNPYANGSFKWFNGASWSDVAAGADMFFTVYLSVNDTALTMPTGYDQYCKLGQVFNDSGSNFVPFKARDRYVKQGANQVVPTGTGINGLTNVADQTITEDLYNGATQGARVPYNAFRVLIGVEVGYSALPASTVIAQANIKPLSSNNDIVRSTVCQPSAGNVGVGMIHCELSYHDYASQIFRVQLFSGDSATANKTLFIDLHGYEWK